MRDTLATLVTQDPAQAGYLATFLTVAMLVLALRKKLGVETQIQHAAPCVAGAGSGLGGGLG